MLKCDGKHTFGPSVCDIKEDWKTDATVGLVFDGRHYTVVYPDYMLNNGEVSYREMLDWYTQCSQDKILWAAYVR